MAENGLQNSLDRFLTSRRRRGPTNFSTSGPRFRASQQRLSRRRGNPDRDSGFPEEPLGPPEPSADAGTGLSPAPAPTPATGTGGSSGTGESVAQAAPEGFGLPGEDFSSLSPELQTLIRDAAASRQGGDAGVALRAPEGSGLSDDAFARLSPSARAAISPFAGQVTRPANSPAADDGRVPGTGRTVPTPVVSGEPGQGLVPTINPATGESVFVDPETAFSSGLNMDDRIAGRDTGGLVGDEIARREGERILAERDAEAQRRFAASPEGREFQNRLTAAALARGPSDFERASAVRSDSITFRREQPGFGSASALERAVPDRGPGEISMERATRLTGGNREAARRMVELSRMGRDPLTGEPAGESLSREESMRLGAELERENALFENNLRNRERLARLQALAEENDLEIPQNIAQGERVLLQVQGNRLDNIEQARDNAAAEIETLQSQATESALESLDLEGTLEDNVDEYLRDNPDATRAQALRTVRDRNDPDMAQKAQEALARAEQEAALLLQNPDSQIGQRLAGLRDRIDQLNQVGLAMQRETPGLAFGLTPDVGNGAPRGGGFDADAADEATVADAAEQTNVSANSGGAAPRQNRAASANGDFLTAMGLPKTTELGATRVNPLGVGLVPGNIQNSIYGANFLVDQMGGVTDALLGETARGTSMLFGGEGRGRFRPLRTTGEFLGNTIGDLIFRQ